MRRRADRRPRSSPRSFVLADWGFPGEFPNDASACRGFPGEFPSRSGAVAVLPHGLVVDAEQLPDLPVGRAGVRLDRVPDLPAASLDWVVSCGEDLRGVGRRLPGLHAEVVEG